MLGRTPINIIQQLLGHEELETTAIYTQVSIEQLKAVHGKTPPRPAKSLKNLLPLAAQSHYPCAWKMAYFSTATAPERRNPTGKNRVWDFFRLSNETHPANRRQPAQPRRKMRPTAMKPVSGIPYWPSRDPIGENGGVNLYGFVSNNPIFHFDVVGLWRSSEHRSITSTAWKNSGVSTDAKGDRYIYTTIETFNVAVDDAPSASDMSQHFNRALNGDIDSARASYSANLSTQNDAFDTLLLFPSRSNCQFALIALGKLTHSWEDYYAHAIGLNSPFRGNPGPIEGSPDSPSTNMKPSSWGGIFNWGEHGFEEPAWRESDGGANRTRAATQFVEGKFKAKMPIWRKACKCFY